MLGTNVMIDLLRGRSRPIRAKFEEASGRIGISAISIMELEYGICRSAEPGPNRKKTESLISLLDVLPFDQTAAANAGALRASLTQLGTSIGPFDTLIAGHARSRGLVLVTNNVREFERVPGLIVENWLLD
jgi:tRNA(fMet)-specific endonuclease VapC